MLSAEKIGYWGAEAAWAFAGAGAIYCFSGIVEIMFLGETTLSNGCYSSMLFGLLFLPSFPLATNSGFVCTFSWLTSSSSSDYGPINFPSSNLPSLQLPSYL